MFHKFHLVTWLVWFAISIVFVNSVHPDANNYLLLAFKLQASAEFLQYANGSIDVTGLCDPIGPAPDYTFTNGCPNTTLPIGNLPSVSAWHFLPVTFMGYVVVLVFKFISS